MAEDYSTLQVLEAAALVKVYLLVEMSLLTFFRKNQ
jgi:hypothetical protein